MFKRRADSSCAPATHSTHDCFRRQRCNSIMLANPRQHFFYKEVAKRAVATQLCRARGRLTTANVTNEDSNNRRNPAGSVEIVEDGRDGDVGGVSLSVHQEQEMIGFASGIIVWRRVDGELSLIAQEFAGKTNRCESPFGNSVAR